ncbi:MAG: hydrolase Nlp/P60 [Coriobacteriaceae bacterium]|nr:hydrolase Nlp/P60 [Coriobacteriaceae bacterium]
MQRGLRARSNIFSKRWLLIFASLFVLSLIFTFTLPTVSAFAEPSSAEKQAEADEAYAKYQAAETEALAATDVYYAALDAHDAAVVAMEETRVAIDGYEQQIAEKQASLSSRVSSMYRSGQTSYLDVLFGARSFWEFISVWDILDSLNDQDAQLISEIKDLREKTQKAYTDYAAQEKLAQRKLEESKAAKLILDEKSANLKEIFDSLSAEAALLLAAEQAAQHAARPGSGGSGGSNDYVNGGSTYSSVAAAAQSQVGKPYDYGATGPNAFDCSGLIYWSYLQCGLTPPPRSSGGMYSAASGIYPVSEAQYGDILYTDGHVGISLGGNEYVHASDYGIGVIISHNASSAFSCVLRF